MDSTQDDAANIIYCNRREFYFASVAARDVTLTLTDFALLYDDTFPTRRALLVIHILWLRCEG